MNFITCVNGVEQIVNAYLFDRSHVDPLKENGKPAIKTMAKHDIFNPLIL